MQTVKVIEDSYTIWLQETRQVNVELEDGRVLGIRRMEDDNGSEEYYQLKPKGEEIYKRGDWKNISEVEWKDDDEAQFAELIACNLFMDSFAKDDVINEDELENPFI